jgi:3-phosphoshikimate 1-carboxyvinyltransferase
MLEAPLRALGVECTTNAGLPPVHVRGPLVGGTVTLDASKTSQFLTGLLFALPLCEQDSTLEVSALASQGYIETTLEVLRAFGVHCECEPGFKRFTVKGRQRFAAREYAVEGDWSGAAFLLVAGAVAGEVEVCGLRVDSTQVDARILDVLAGCGAAVDVGESVHVAKSALRAFRYDVTDTPDLLPALAALACSCEGTSEILGVERTRQKESDRVLAISSALGGLGADIRVEADRLLVTGGTLHGGAADPQGDHRIAMAAAVAALRASGAVEISDPQCVAKSYPSFFDDLRSLRP